MNLKIKCPSCERQFNVHEDLTGKKVECGGCDHQFKIGPEVVVAEKEKFYPGEHHDNLLDRLGKTPTYTSSPSDVQFQTASYNKSHSAESVMPATAGQNIALMAGLALFVFYALVYLVSTAGDKGMFTDMPIMKRYLLAGFVCAVATGMVFYGAKNWRWKSVLLSAALTAGILILVSIREVAVTPVSKVDDDFVVKPVVKEVDAEKEQKNQLDEHFESMSLYPIDEAIEKAKAKGLLNPEASVVGIYFKNYNEGLEEHITGYYRRKVGMGKDEAPLVLSRGDYECLMVLSGLDVDFDFIMTLTEKIGTTKSYPERRLIESEIDGLLFADPGRDLLKRLIDPENPAFYKRNLIELEHVNFNRVKQAVERLRNVPETAEKKFTPEISKKLLELIRTENDKKFREMAAEALIKWGKGDEELVARASRLILQWNNMGKEIPVPLIDFVVQNGSQDIAEILDKLWVGDPLKWRTPYENLGSVAESMAIKHLSGESIATRREAIKVLGNIGGRQALNALLKMDTSRDSELHIYGTNAIKSIQERLK